MQNHPLAAPGRGPSRSPGESWSNELKNFDHQSAIILLIVVFSATQKLAENAFPPRGWRNMMGNKEPLHECQPANCVDQIAAEMAEWGWGPSRDEHGT
jgi:hypothetical protein